MNESNAATQPIALITGAAKRVGRKVAIELSEAGFLVHFTYNHSVETASSLLQILRQNTPDSQMIQVDMADPITPARLSKWLRTHTVKLDLLINNASIYAPCPFDQLTMEHYQEQQLINTQAPIFVTQALLPLLKMAQQPQIIHIVDAMLMEHGRSGYLAYNISKAGLLQSIYALAKELAPKIRVNGIAPGAVMWPANATDQYKTRVLEQVPLNRVGSDKDIAKAIRYLALDGPYVTGHVLHVDGGRRLG